MRRGEVLSSECQRVEGKEMEETDVGGVLIILPGSVVAGCGKPLRNNFPAIKNFL